MKFDRLSFDRITIEANRLLDLHALAPSYDRRYYNAYIDYLSACGWTDEEIDAATLKFIDANWEPTIVYN